ncbi:MULTISPECIES: polysaccharide deacetylase family protein [unclassified Paenibacillus]|uniref:polysaccharide deacetylase family protein n=1 Tax=unclassified Paenibacillus TaxID=185978 RepID=UPI000CFCC280|nr:MULTISPECIES: polysaccharide deacetylase family protein [unclassified Paenibacillus]MBD8836347.1 polysaccharide deacetylase family protein [Paenibacillus sp. CFBP 13594]PRA05154.1 xylanase deacetylase [Paenibacillus sp. MYb63]PRA47501.1 xylanase deacetylase [Paenibacillus sp. MYb67]
MFRHTAALIIAASLLLSACGTAEEKTSDNPTPAGESTTTVQEEQGNSNPTKTGEPGTGVPEPSTEDSTATEEEPESSEKVSTEKKVEKTYHMNENYYIKPNVEASPNKVVLLTFDDGPKEEKMITSLIDTLDKHNAKAIFFVNGYRVKSHPELLKLIHERGQIVGNHAWDHEDLKKMSNAEAAKQVTDVQKIVKDTIGEEPQFFRPPFGSGNDALKAAVKKNGMLYMTWSNGSLDWDKSTKDKPEKVIQNVLDQLNPGSNILMHELPWTVEALDELLTKLEKKGYSFVDPRAIELEAR